MTTAAVLASVPLPAKSTDSRSSREYVTLSSDAIARHATRALWNELALFPKPGLVSLRDSGAHSDMDASTFVRSLFALRGHFRVIVAAGASAAPFAQLCTLGLQAEQAMLRATGGVNTHRGAIFALGLLGAAFALTSARSGDISDDAVRSTLTRTWGAALETGLTTRPRTTHGAQVEARYGARGARGEAHMGFPAVFEVGLPVLRSARRRGLDAQRARLAAFFALLENVDDTNVLYRGGTAGLQHVRRSAAEFHARGGVEQPDGIACAEKIHRDFVDRGLSPGGCADLLASTLFVDSVQGAGGMSDAGARGELNSAKCAGAQPRKGECEAIR